MPAATPREDVDADLVAADRDAGEPRHGRVAADGVDVAADDGGAEEDREQRPATASSTRIGTGKNSSTPLPRTRNCSLTMLTELPPEVRKAKPRNAAIVPSVAITALTRP